MDDGLKGRLCGCDAHSMPGFVALRERVDAIYGESPVKHYGTTDPIAAGGMDPLDAISGYPNDEPSPHFHLVSFGLTELGPKEFPSPEVSGFGFELTMRLSRSMEQNDVPPWAMSLMQMLGQYCHVSGVPFSSGESMFLGGSICPSVDSTMTAVCFAPDRQLGSLQTPNGFMTFLQIVGIHADELAVIKDWNPHEVIDLLSQQDPLLMTDLTRPSILKDKAIADMIARRMKSEGSTQSKASGGDVRWERDGADIALHLGAIFVGDLKRGLSRRIPFALPFELAGQERRVAIEPADETSIDARGGKLSLSLRADAARGLAEAIRPERGVYTCSDVPGLTVIVSPTEIGEAEVIG